MKRIAFILVIAALLATLSLGLVSCSDPIDDGSYITRGGGGVSCRVDGDEIHMICLHDGQSMQDNMIFDVVMSYTVEDGRIYFTVIDVIQSGGSYDHAEDYREFYEKNSLPAINGKPFGKTDIGFYIDESAFIRIDG